MIGEDTELADVVIVNESPADDLPGAVSVFRSEGEACQYLEYWWVQNGEGFAFTATGVQLILDAEEFGQVFVRDRVLRPDGTEIVLRCLEATARHMLDVRREKAAKRKVILAGFEERGDLPGSIAGLIAYIGFDR